MPWPYWDHPRDDDEPTPEDWVTCAEHHEAHPPDEWCPVCLDDARREAKQLGETMPWTKLPKVAHR